MVQTAAQKGPRDSVTSLGLTKTGPPDQDRAQGQSAQAIARGRQWLEEIVSGAVQDVKQIAKRHHCSVRHVNMTMSMAFIAPSLVEAAVQGRLPRGIGVASLRDAPAEWSLQFERLGLIESSTAR